MRAWDAIVVYLTGKHLAVLGPRGAGKTTLHSVLERGALPDQVEQTVVSEKTPPARSRSTGLKLRRGVDLPGGDRAYEDWRRQFLKSDVVFYLFDAYRIRTDSKYEQRVTQDGRQLREWGVARKEVFLLGTHIDEDPLLEELGAAEYANVLLDRDALVAMKVRVQARGAYVASLLTTDGAISAVRKVIGA